MIKKIWNRSAKIILILCGMILIGALLLVLVYLFPTGKIKDNVAKSSYIFDIEGAYPALIPGYEFTKLDNFTDSIMLAIAMYDGEEEASEKAMANYRMRSDELGTVKSTTHYANGVQAEYYVHGYHRYWHGYLVYLKPLLAFFTYGQIRILNSIFQVFLMLAIATKMLRNGLQRYIIPYVLTILFLNPATISLSLQYSAIFNITLVCTVTWLYLLEKGKLCPDKTWILFLIAGCVTSYVDFLTYPIAVVGMLSNLYLNSFEDKCERFWELITNIVIWGIGYIGMWAGKWIVGSLILKENLFFAAFEKIKLRSSNSGEEGGRFIGIIDNLNIYNDKIFVLLACASVICCVLVLIRRKVHIEKKHVKILGMYMLIALMPWVWMLLASNHVHEHAWFAYRNLSVTILSMGCMYIYIRDHCCKTCSRTDFGI